MVKYLKWFLVGGVIVVLATSGHALPTLVLGGLCLGMGVALFHSAGITQGMHLASISFTHLMLNNTNFDALVKATRGGSLDAMKQAMTNTIEEEKKRAEGEGDA